MKTLKLLLVISCVVLCPSCRGCSSQKQPQMPEISYVYVCTGGSSTKYHSYSGCRGLSNCKGFVVRISESDALDMGRTECQICY